MIEAGATSTLGRTVLISHSGCARPTGGKHARTTHGPAQRSRGVKKAALCEY